MHENAETMADHDHQASRTLVKSAPELWAECSDAASLAKHLGAFGEIRITKLEPETAVVWEGDAARGTVRLEPSGWGTRVVLTVRRAEPAQPPSAESTAAPSAEPSAGPPADSASEVRGLPATPHRGLLSRIMHRWRGRTSPTDEAAGSSPADEPTPAPAPVDGAGEATRDALGAALDSLGSAHHRPYSRA